MGRKARPEARSAASTGAEPGPCVTAGGRAWPPAHLRLSAEVPALAEPWQGPKGLEPRGLGVGAKLAAPALGEGVGAGRPWLAGGGLGYSFKSTAPWKET